MRKLLCAFCKLSRHDLADKVGVSRQWIIEAEKGKARAEIGLILRTLNAVGIDLRTEERSPQQPAKRAAAGPDIDAIVAEARKPR